MTATKINIEDLPTKYDAQETESRIYKFWEDGEYFKADNKSKKPPYSIVIPPPNVTGVLHMGHALDGTLQDILTRYHRMAGYEALWLPGTDHAGIATQAVVERELRKEGLSRFDLGREKFLEKTWEWANEHKSAILNQFKRLGASFDRSRERFTFDKGCSDAVKEVFVTLYNKGLIYKGAYIVNWCPRCMSAISDIETEYKTEQGHLWEISYPVKGEHGAIIVATTRPETIFGDVAIAVHPDDHKYSELIGKTVIIPLSGREIPIIADEYVDRNFGTGAVKITPAHDPNDYEVGKRHNFKPIWVIDEEGKMKSCAEVPPEFQGLDRYECRKKLIGMLEYNKFLLRTTDHEHNVGKCQRCGTTIEPLLSEQWFVKMEPLAKEAIAAVKDGRIKFIPQRWEKDYLGWMENIRDWCISRQRAWGVPIPIFYCEDCGEVICTDETINHVAELFEKESSDAWVKYDESKLLPEGFKCPKCGKTHFRKEKDIMDVWFDSGSSWRTVVEKRSEELGHTPVDMYLEGSDQHRGWFQSSLLTSIACQGKAPYKQVLTHGFVFGEDGRKMSKSLGNYIRPDDIIKNYGADILRLWAASVDYRNDIKIGDNIIKQLAEIFKKTRNTARFLLGNLFDFNPSVDYVKYNELKDIDKFALHKLNSVVEEVTKAFDSYEFYKYFQCLQNFAAVDLSSFYLDIVKDRLYTAGKKSLSRRACQTVLYETLLVLVKILTPVMPHQAEDIWQNTPECMRGGLKSVLLIDWPQVKPEWNNEKLEENFTKILKAREVVTRAIEPLRADKKVGSSLEVGVYVKAEHNSEVLKTVEKDLADIFITSQAYLTESAPSDVLNEYSEDDYTVWVVKAEGEKCERCWKYRKLGEHSGYETICSDCYDAIQ